MIILKSIATLIIYYWLYKKIGLSTTEEIIKKYQNEYVACEDIICFP
jgi:hypothetical protein